MKVCEFIHFRRRVNDKTHVSARDKRPSYVYNSNRDGTSNYNPQDRYNQAVIDIDELSASIIRQSGTNAILPIDLTAGKHTISTILSANDHSSVCHDG